MKKVSLEERLWVVLDDNNRARGYEYRRRLPFFDKGKRKYQDIRKRLGSNLDKARAKVKQFDAQYDQVERGTELRLGATVRQFYEWFIREIREVRKLAGWRTIKDSTEPLVRYLCVDEKGNLNDPLLARITRGDIEKFFATPMVRMVSKKDVEGKVPTDQPLSQATVHTRFRHIRRMFRVARESGFLQPEGRLPTDGVKVKAPALGEPRTPTSEDVGTILVHLKEKCQWLYRFCLALIFTGARSTEVLTLTWERVGFARSVKDDTLTLVRTKVGDTLTVPMTETLQRTLFAMWMEAGQPVEGYVFHTRSGRPIGKFQAYKAFKREVRRIDGRLAWIRPKDFRKYAATVPDMWDAVNLLGHSTAEITAKHYRGARMESRSRAVDAIEKTLGLDGQGEVGTNLGK